jgi:hypothetical protein
METFLVLAAFLIVVIWGADRHLCLKEVEKDLKLYLSNVEAAEALSEPPVRVHISAQVFALRSLINHNFKLKEHRG